ncbi:uncharacterized protein HKW66_Vig0041640 [Vigna angularis]|uniref:Uncharacterized protein n=2 Tax=Phaseolus angularis TaxID=3914 RepID=A0A8T0KZP1_PHAAN|nr:uncharacterized protein HKW66_Vig0041640 [Vigna angularis]
MTTSKIPPACRNEWIKRGVGFYFRAERESGSKLPSFGLLNTVTDTKLFCLHPTQSMQSLPNSNKAESLDQRTSLLRIRLSSFEGRQSGGHTSLSEVTLVWIVSQYFVSVCCYSLLLLHFIQQNTVMAQQEEGWPLGLRFLNSRLGLVRNGSGSASFSTVLTASHTPSTVSSSDLDTESTGSFFRDNSITLGSLIGISSFLELSGRSTRGRMVEASKDSKRIHKLKPWLFSLCSRLSTDAVSGNDAPSLGHTTLKLREEQRVHTEGTSVLRLMDPMFSPLFKIQPHY